MANPTPPNKPNSSPGLTEVNDWLIRQLKAWPTRIDPDRTTNIEYLMKRAAAAIEALSTKNELPSEIELMARALSDAASTTFKKANGTIGTIEGDDGEMCFIVPHDEMIELRAALNPKDTGHAS
jgi:hypothetical protein